MLKASLSVGLFGSVYGYRKDCTCLIQHDSEHIYDQKNEFENKATKNVSACSHINTWSTLFHGNTKKVSHQAKFSKFSIYSSLNLAANAMHFNKTHFCAVNYKKNFCPSNIRPWRAVVVQPVQFNSTTRRFANRKKQNSETVTIHVQL